MYQWYSKLVFLIKTIRSKMWRVWILLFILLSVMNGFATSALRVAFYDVSTQYPIEPQEEITVDAEMKYGVCNLFSQIDALRVRVKRRALKDVDSKPSQRSFSLIWQNRYYDFDAWGGFIIDRDYILVEDVEIISRFEVFFKAHYSQTHYAKAGHPLLEVPLVEVSALPVFPGFEAARYQKHDALILKLVKEFNEDPAKAIGASKEMLVDIPYLDPALVKSMMIEETGGNGPRSTRAWNVDPLQVNVPGDWAPVKKELGLRKPSARNEGSLEKNLRAGILFLARKGYGVSGASLKQRPTAYFDSWRVALQRYNGRTAERIEGVTYAEAYANRILQRVQHPHKRVPIATDKYLY